MPYMQAMTARANTILSAASINALDANLFGPGRKLADVAKDVGIALREEEYVFLDSWPTGMKEAIRALVHSALTRDPRLPVTIVWQPGYDFGMTVSEAAGTPRSVGGMTIVLQSRYPDDALPVVR